MAEVEARMTRYLLGELSQEEMLKVENEYFRDEEYFESIQALEDQLVRDFVTGEMDPDLRRRFEARYRGSPELAKKIEFSQAVLSGCSRLREEANAGVPAPSVGLASRLSLRDFFRFRISVFQYAGAVVALLGIGLGYFEWTQNSHLKLTLARVQQENKSLAEAKSALNRALSERLEEPPLVASFVLIPGVSRSEGVAEPLVVPSVPGRVEFKLPLPSGVGYPLYRAVLQKLPAGQISSQDLQPSAIVDSGSALIVGIPSASLKAARYVLYLKGRNARGDYVDVQYYAFAVEK